MSPWSAPSNGLVRAPATGTGRRLAWYSRRSRRAAWILVTGLLARTGFAADPVDTSGDARAPDASERAVELNEQGSALYAAGDYRRAAERFLQAYAVEEDANLLFNIASCYEALGDTDAAVEKYRAFLAAPDTDPVGRPRAELAIARLTAVAPEPSEPPEPPALSAPVAVVPAERADGQTRDVEWWPWVGVAGGIGLGAAGAALYLMGADDHSRVTDTPGFDDRESVANITRGRAHDLIRSGDTKKAIGVASSAAGAALIAGAVVWWLLEPPEPSDREAGVGVTLEPSRAGLRFNGVF